MQARNYGIRRRRDSRAPMVAGNGPLSRVPPAVAFLAVIVVFALAVWLRGGIGAALLGLLDVGVLAMLAVTWQALRPVERALRVIVVLILAGIAISLLR